MPEKPLQELLADLARVSPEMRAVVNAGPSIGLLWELEIAGASEQILRDLAKDRANDAESRWNEDVKQTTRAAQFLYLIHCHKVAGNHQRAKELWEKLLTMGHSTHPAVLEDIGVAALLQDAEAARQAVHVPIPQEGIRRAIKGLAESNRVELEAACAWFDGKPFELDQGTESWYRIVRFRLGKALEAMG